MSEVVCETYSQIKHTEIKSLVYIELLFVVANESIHFNWKLKEVPYKAENSIDRIRASAYNCRSLLMLVVVDVSQDSN